MKSLYATLMDETVLPIIQPLWKLKIPLKIKVFIWLLHRGVILTKDNLARRNWKGSMLCCYCSDKENIAHLFFNCSSTSLLWRTIYTTFGLSRPNSVNHLFGSWLRGLTKSHKNLVYTGIAALCWAIWRSRNDTVFQKTKNQTSLQILFRATYLTRAWTILHEEDREAITAALSQPLCNKWVDV